MIIKSRENKLPPTKIRQKNYSYLFHIAELQLNWLQTVYMKYAKNYSHELSLKSKFLSRSLKKPKSAKLNSHKNLVPHGFRRCGNCERFCLSCNLSAFVSRFQQSRIGNCVNFSGKKVTAPKSESARTPMLPKFIQNLFTYAEGYEVRVSPCILLKENFCLKAKLIEIKFIYRGMYACIEFKLKISDRKNFFLCFFDNLN